MSVCVDRDRNKILVETTLRGFFVIDGTRVRNRFTRNFGYILDGLLRRVDVTVYDEAGSTRTQSTSSGGLLYYFTSSNQAGSALVVQYGTGATSPTVTDNNLASPAEFIPTSIVDIIEDVDKTEITIGGRMATSAIRVYREMGLKLQVYGTYRTLLARSLIPETTRTPYVMFTEGYVLSFPATFTRWFIRALHCAVSGHYASLSHCMPARRSDGTTYVIRNADTFAGSPDLAIGSDNSPPSPEDHGLRAGIASLASQSQAVEVDTALNEVRVVRTGTYTPATETVLGEIGLYVNINGFIEGTLGAQKTLLVRVPLETPITLSPGTTYTIGLVIKL